MRELREELEHIRVVACYARRTQFLASVCLVDADFSVLVTLLDHANE